jgi:hypothetical protein
MRPENVTPSLDKHKSIDRRRGASILPSRAVVCAAGRLTCDIRRSARLVASWQSAAEGRRLVVLRSGPDCHVVSLVHPDLVAGSGLPRSGTVCRLDRRAKPRQMTRSAKIRIFRPGLGCCSCRVSVPPLSRSGGKELDRAGERDGAVEDEEAGEAGVVVVDRVGGFAGAFGCLRDRHGGEAAGGVAD